MGPLNFVISDSSIRCQIYFFPQTIDTLTDPYLLSLALFKQQALSIFILYIFRECTNLEARNTTFEQIMYCLWL